jgi:prepilin-type N-terminal cleavage/methylation domain-containing protein
MRRGFTLLEVVISLGIMATALAVLVQSQAFAVMSAQDAEHLIRSTQLAEEKMMEVQLLTEREGFSDQDMEEDGDFDEFGAEEFRGDSLDLELEDELNEYKWAYTVRKIEIKMPPNLGGMASDLAGGGYFGDEKSQEVDVGGAPDLTSMGVSGDTITDTLGEYIREVRVRVWWGDDPENESQMVELTSHIINPAGAMGGTSSTGGATSGSMGGGSKKGGNTRRGGRNGPRGGQNTPQLRGNK